MDTYITYVVIITLITTDLWQPSHSDPVRKTRVASDFDEDPLSRKIVPKSVFIAPSFGCPHGYAMGDNGECLSIVRISMNNQYEFILARISSNLNSDRGFYSRSKKDTIQEPETTTTTVPPSTTKVRKYHNIRPKKRKHKVDRNTEGPVRISIPLPASWEK